MILKNWGGGGGSKSEKREKKNEGQKRLKKRFECKKGPCREGEKEFLMRGEERAESRRESEAREGWKRRARREESAKKKTAAAAKREEALLPRAPKALKSPLFFFFLKS